MGLLSRAQLQFAQLSGKAEMVMQVRLSLLPNWGGASLCLPLFAAGGGTEPPGRLSTALLVVAVAPLVTCSKLRSACLLATLLVGVSSPLVSLTKLTTKFLTYQWVQEHRCVHMCVSGSKAMKGCTTCMPSGTAVQSYGKENSGEVVPCPLAA
jgi:hypothetical protein